MDKRIREKIGDLRSAPITFQIGKNGLTAEVIKEIDLQLKKKEVIKGKIFKTALLEKGKDEILSLLKNQLRIQGMDIRGSTIILYRKKSKSF